MKLYSKKDYAIILYLIGYSMIQVPMFWLMAYVGTLHQNGLIIIGYLVFSLILGWICMLFGALKLRQIEKRIKKLRRENK